MILTSFDRARYPENWLKLCPTEEQVQAAILDLLGFKGVEAVAVDVGAKKIRGRANGLAKRLGASSVDISKLNLGKTGAGAEGLSDIIGTLPGGRALYVEVKAPAWLNFDGTIRAAAGKPSAAQLAFLRRMEAKGAAVGVAWSVDDVLHLLPP